MGKASAGAENSGKASWKSQLKGCLARGKEAEEAERIAKRGGWIPKNVAVGSFLSFGRYPQKSEERDDLIEWQVLKVSEGVALVVSRFVLDWRCFHNGEGRATWKTCSLRRWLNGDFCKRCFKPMDLTRIVTSDVDKSWFDWYTLDGGNSTRDRLFLLSRAEADNLFASAGERRAKATQYAISHGARVPESKDDDDYGMTGWWLRSGGASRDGRGDNGSVAWVVNSGFVDKYGVLGTTLQGVRPAMRLKLEV